MEKYKYSIRVAEEFSSTPVGRWIELGDFSGEDFFNRFLLPRYTEACGENEKLHIYLDGAVSYPRSFLDQAFGELARQRTSAEVNHNIVFHTNNFQWVIEYIKIKLWDVSL